MSTTSPLVDRHGREYRLLRARDILPGDEVLFDAQGAGYRVESVDTDSLGQARHRFGGDTGSSSYDPMELLRVAETPRLVDRVKHGWDQYIADAHERDAAPVVSAATSLQRVTAIFWQPNERMLTVRTADGGNTQLCGRLSQDELAERLGEDLAERIQMPERLAPELSDLAVHALRGEELGFLRLGDDGVLSVVPSLDDVAERTALRP